MYAIEVMSRHRGNPGAGRLAHRDAHDDAPFDTARYAMKWDGEWHITYEVFRDLGLAFAAVLVLIYVLVVGWFRSFVRRSSSWRRFR